MPERLRLSRAKGWRKPEGAVVVARPTLWGNPFVVGRHGTRAQVVARYAILTGGGVDLGHPIGVEAQLACYYHQRANRDAIAGRDLLCWCDLDGPCHADVLLAWAQGSLGAMADLVLPVELPPAIYMRVEDMEQRQAFVALQRRV